MEYSTLSKNLTANIPKNIKRSNGIFFTPPSCVYKNIDIIRPYVTKTTTILEPSCGSGEYILALNKTFPTLNITGIEHNKTIYNDVKQLNNKVINIKYADYLTIPDNTKYDLIIGNPPYYVMKKSEVNNIYYDYFEGRPNIFILFIIKSLKLLNENGILSFVLPKNFLSCLCYEKMRNYIFNSYQIIDIIDCSDKYLEIKQKTIIVILQHQTDISKINNNKYKSNINNYTILGIPSKICELNELLLNSKTLSQLGFKVNVGNIIWNQCKDILTTDDTKTTLIYSSNITNNQFSIKTYKNEARKNYIDKEGITTPTLVVNRGYGGANYTFDYCLIEGDFEYLVENHLICITHIDTSADKITLIETYKNLITSLKDPRTAKFIQLYFGNNAINTTELTYILPIY